MAKTWREVEASEEYKSLPAAERYAAREQYFREVIAPQVPEGERDAVKEMFYEDTHDNSFGTLDEIGLAVGDMGRVFSNAATFNLADKAVAAGRAAFDSDLDYAQAIEQERAMTRQARERAGWAGTAGDVIGGGALGVGLARQGLSVVGSQAAQRSGLIGKTLAGAADGALMGAAYGAGGDDSGLSSEKLAAAGLGAATGGAVGALAAPLTAGLSGLAAKIMGNGGARPQLEGQTLSRGSSAMAQRAYGNGRGQEVLQRLQQLGPDSMALNASPDMKGAALGVVARGGQPGEVVEQALESQMRNRSDRLFQGIDDALGPVGRDTKLIIESLDEAKGDLNRAFTSALRSTTVKAPGRQRIATIAANLGKDFSANSTVRPLFNRFANMKNLPQNGLQLKNLVNNELSRAARKNPGAAVQINTLRKAINAELMASSRDYKFLHESYRANRESFEAVSERGARFFDDNIKPREITADMANNAAQAPAMREAARSTVDDMMRTRSNEISSVQKLVGRTANAQNREKVARIFGPEARDRLAQTVDAEVTKSRDFGEIMRNSNTARKQAAMQAIEEDGLSGLIPENRTTGGIVSDLVFTAVRKFRDFVGDRSSESSRAMLAKLATMNAKQLREFIREIDRAAEAARRSGRNSAAAVGGAVATANGAVTE